MHCVLYLSVILVVPVLCFYDSTDDVVELTPSNFQNLVKSSSDLWLIEFYAPWCGHCQSLAPEWKKAASALKGFVKVGAVDMDKYQQFGSEYGIKGFPTIKIFGENKALPTDYQGQRTAQSIVQTAMQQAKLIIESRMGSSQSSQSGGSSGSGSGSQGDGEVIELTDSNFQKLVLDSDDTWLVEFFAPWCGHCKNLKPHWEGAAKKLGGKVKLGAMDATVYQSIPGRYGVNGFPTIKYFPAGKKSGDAMDYDGGRTEEEIVRWAMDKAAASLPPPEVYELTSADIFKQNCDDHQLCVISVLPALLDCQADCRNKYIDILNTVGEKYKQKEWGWLWAEAMSQPKLETTFEIGGFGYPAMVVLNSRKMKYAILKGPFSDTGIHEFLRAVSMGRGSTVSIRGDKLPDILQTDKWDGKDGQASVDDEISLEDLGIETPKSEL